MIDHPKSEKTSSRIGGKTGTARSARPLRFDATRSYIIRSLNATANKPLHLGHLRNATLGAATASSLRALGVEVLRHCVVEDTGRFMSEAMVAYAEHQRAGKEPPEGVKSDQFIGACYAEYRRRNARGKKKATTGYEARNDDADRMLRALAEGDAGTREVWRQVRTMALEGQQATLRRVGLGFDCCDYESAEDAALDGFFADGIERGMFARNEAGELLFTSAGGRTLRLVNRAGLPEESARLLSFIRRLLGGRAGDQTHVIMAGSEWRKPMSLYAELLQRMGVRHSTETYVQAFYAMVMIGGKKMASSIGSGVLVDHLLDTLVESEAVREVAARSSGRVGETEVAAMLLKAFLLAFPRGASIDFSPGALADPGRNPGWEIARAWVELAPADSAPAPSERLRPLIEGSVSAVSFEDPVAHAASLARRIANGSGTGEDERELRVLVDALALTPMQTDFSYERAATLAVEPRPAMALDG
jgi:tRNA synthetases class I (R)